MLKAATIVSMDIYLFCDYFFKITISVPNALKLLQY